MRSAVLQIKSPKGDGKSFDGAGALIGTVTMFIDGMPADHECNSNGDMVYETASGKRIYWNTHKQWASFTTMARQPILLAHYEDIGDPILMHSVSCSICKQAAFDQAAWL